MKRLFAASALASSLVLHSAAGQMIADNDILVASEGPATIIKFPESSTVTNGFRIVCPTDPLYSQSRGHGRALVFLFNHAREQLASEYEHSLRYPPSEDDREIGTTGTGFIDQDNSLIPTLDSAARMKAAGHMLATQGALSGANPQDPALIRALRRYAEDYCFSLS